ncbi:MAG TPA: hypothetical protein VHE83_08980 [Mycobacteriales bacterium]|nr:hypothetical protein [Mycobacteriales bacterium]
MAARPSMTAEQMTERIEAERAELIDEIDLTEEQIRTLASLLGPR